MTQGIREFVNTKFAQTLPQLKELGNTGFRKAVMQAAITQFSISIASAATHYNHSLKLQRAADPVSVEGLGRPEGKKGGRKPKAAVAAAVSPVVAQLFDVVKLKTGEVVAAGLTKDAADQLIAMAAKQKKARLFLKLPDVHIEVVADDGRPEEAAE